MIRFKMNQSRQLQTAVQIVGSSGEILLFLAGFFLGAKVFIAAGILIGSRVGLKIIMSELMYRRHMAVIREGFEEAKVSEVTINAKGT